MNASQRDELLIDLKGTTERLDERTENMASDLAEMKEWQRDQNGDIAALRAWQAKLTGAFCVLAAVVLFFQAEIMEVVTHVFGG